MQNNESNPMNFNAQQVDLSTLHTQSMHGFLYPLARRLGGVKAARPGAWSARDLVMALIKKYGHEAVRHEASEMQAQQAQQAKSSAQTLADAIAQVVAAQAPGVDEALVRSLCEEVIADARGEIIAEARKTMPLTVEVKIADCAPINVGVQHHKFGTLLKMCNARIPNGRRCNIWLHGPAGTGKTSAAKSVATAMGLPFYYSGAVTSAFQLMGYVDAHGRTVRTPFREAWENGGIFLLDEIDASEAVALTALTTAIDGQEAAFPDRMVARHADCVLLAGGNTVGRGGNSKYVGRMAQDAAVLTRWIMLEWAHDDNLETAIVGSDEHGQRALHVVRAYRAAAANEKIDGASTSTRASIDLATLLRAGIDEAEAISCTIRKGMPSDSWNRLTARCAL